MIVRYAAGHSLYYKCITITIQVLYYKCIQALTLALALCLTSLFS
jgi:hypothetical protein